MRVGVCWHKLFRDIWQNKIRTTLVVLSIAVGVFAIGMVAGCYEIISKDLTNSYIAVNPANATIYLGPLRPEFIETIGKIKGVNGAEGRREISVRVRFSPNDEWRKLSLIVLPDYKDMRIDKIKLLSGTWPPPEKEMLIERGGLVDSKPPIGKTVEIECPDRKKTYLGIAGIVHDINQVSPVFSGKMNGYITMDTLEALGLTRQVDSINFTVKGNPPSEEAIRQTAQKVWDKVEKSGYRVEWLEKKKPGEHPAQSIINALLMIMGLIGVLSLALSGFLLVNTISALLTRERRQLGVMKAVGATIWQVSRLYMAYVFCYSILALLLAIPLGALAAKLAAEFIAGLINFDIIGFKLSYPILFAEALSGLCVPAAAALYPVLSGARITVREAISSSGVHAEALDGRLNRIVRNIMGLPISLFIALRNVFRRKGRLFLTLFTLIISGVVFISVCSVRQSVVVTLDDALGYFKYDLEIYYGKWYKTQKLKEALQGLDGVSRVESWSFDSGRLLSSKAKDSESTTIAMLAPPNPTEMLKPILLEGRWLLPEDENAVVVNTEVLKDHPDIKVGDELTIKLNSQERRKSQWKVVGIVRGVMTGPLLYTNYSYFSRFIGKPDQGMCTFIVTEDSGASAQTKAVKMLEESLKKQGLQVSSVTTMADIRGRIQSQFDVLVIFMLIMALLLAGVGGLGLMGTMSINVMERTLEIGIMRSLGATNWTIRKIFIAEGILIGVLSWVIAMSIAFPISKVFSDQVGRAFMQAPFSFEFSLAGGLLWLIIVLVIAALASILPASKASRLSIQETLSYE